VSRRRAHDGLSSTLSVWCGHLAEPPSTYSFSDEEVRRGSEGRREKYFSVIAGVDPTLALPEAWLHYDQMSATAFLRDVGASSGAIASYHDAFAPDDSLDNLSALALIREVANFSREIGLTGKGGRIAGGADKLPTATAERLGKRVSYGAKIVRIEQTKTGVRVVFERAGQTESIEAGRAVCALPSTALGAISFQPALSTEKRRAIRDLTMVSVSRVFVVCERRIWTEQGQAGAVETDDWLHKLTDETDPTDAPGGVLGVYAVGDAARRIAAMSAADRLSAVGELAERSHPGVKPLIYGGASKCWDDDPLQRGAYAHLRPRELTTLATALAKAEHAIHFAGDQTSYRPGFMHGALGSAKRVLSEIAG